MSSSHHEANSESTRDPEAKKLLQQLLDQCNDRAKRLYPQGRLGPNDDGEIAFAMAADKERKLIIWHLGKPVTGFALRPEEAVVLINLLKSKLAELGETVTITV